MKQNIPIVCISATITGLTITSPKLNTPRYVPFDISGKCKTCRAEDVEIDYVITMGGIYIISNRLKKEKFVEFDIIEKFGENNVFRFKVKRKVFTIQEKETNLFVSQSIKDNFYNVKWANGNNLLRLTSTLNEYLEFPEEKNMKMEEEKKENNNLLRTTSVIDEYLEFPKENLKLEEEKNEKKDSKEIIEETIEP
ncbi:hypothetical protein ACQ4LE_006147 [Meloidogyne hapla]|uniref:Uncharacterized protein n=1 Tax=Meloidogyne hapla TaxID=6305 RepID=A0A1I8B063_MELHA